MNQRNHLHRFLKNIYTSTKPCRNLTRTYRVPVARYTVNRFKFEELSQAGSLLPQHLPESVVDTMQLCRDMNERYLWVDRLRIMKDDKEFQMLQINRMNVIYQLAEFTIVAAADGIGAGLPGVSTRPRIASHKNDNRLMRVEHQSMDLSGEAVVTAAYLLWIRSRLSQLLP
ncbi:hypothetical protein CI238_04960 [Colletotrichum incanum]|uniref:Heterokaryon incompatibility domain-containing protein n=1 Tax=Colletotrichum incanum TaxID=1573173 RepID=A0A167DLF4_COLIC|nr:hypothetical protein CI238_04960 [Colletotrichum incanum]